MEFGMGGRLARMLWLRLSQLVDSNDAFYFQDFVLDDVTYRIFNYRMASYTDFLQPAALECRGIMFDVTDINNVGLVCLPQEKFFNLNENPMTMDLDLTKVSNIELKADGSLISTYLHNGELRLKSKGSIASEQAIDAMAWLLLPENDNFRSALKVATSNGFTVNLEWTAPFNRIVISYQKPGLIGLNMRHMDTGAYMSLKDIQTITDDSGVYEAMLPHWIEELDLSTIDDVPGFVTNIPDMMDIEGYIIKFENGQNVKIKTHWYLVQHRAKDSVNSDRRLFETVVADAQDDLRSLFFDDEWVLKRIQWMEDLVGAEYNTMVQTVEDFCNANLRLDRKEFAIKAKAEIKPLWFGLCMNLYLGKTVDWKGFMMSKWKAYGIKDQQKGEV
jgi:T4 RnlA family RNA ligase